MVIDLWPLIISAGVVFVVIIIQHLRRSREPED